MNFTQRILGDKIRENEIISYTFWKKLTKILNDLYENYYFSFSYPLKFPAYDNGYYSSDARFANCVYGSNEKELSEDITFYVGEELSWPLETKKKKLHPKTLGSTSHSTIEEWKPTDFQVFDLIEFLYKKTHTVKVNIDYINESYEDVELINILKFPKNDNSAKEYFAEKINTLLRDAKMIYEFDLESGQIKTILSAETKLLINSALNCGNFKFDSVYQQMLQSACDKVSSTRFEHKYDSLKNLWEAFERLKCYFSPKNQSEKLDSSQKIVDLFYKSPLFKKEVNEEMIKLTRLGNKLRIRHSETYQEDLLYPRQINYLFNRCLSMIVLIQDQIVASEKT